MEIQRGYLEILYTPCIVYSFSLLRKWFYFHCTHQSVLGVSLCCLFRNEELNTNFTIECKMYVGMGLGRIPAHRNILVSVKRLLFVLQSHIFSLSEVIRLHFLSFARTVSSTRTVSCILLSLYCSQRLRYRALPNKKVRVPNLFLSVRTVFLS